MQNPKKSNFARGIPRHFFGNPFVQNLDIGHKIRFLSILSCMEAPARILRILGTPTVQNSSFKHSEKPKKSFQGVVPGVVWVPRYGVKTQKNRQKPPKTHKKPKIFIFYAYKTHGLSRLKKAVFHDFYHFQLVFKVKNRAKMCKNPKNQVLLGASLGIFLEIPESKI